jgi:large subunit ribosomal protein L10
MPRTDKLERVAELKRRIEDANALLLTEYRGLTVSEITTLRRSLRDADASFAVVKNTLMQRAAAEAGLEIADLLAGPSAVAFVGGDAVTAAKQIKSAAKQFPSLVLKGGFMDGQVLSADDANRLADLEGREVMLSKIAGLLKGEMSRAASMFVSVPSRFLSLLEAFQEKLPAEAGPASDDVAPDADTNPAPAANDTGEEASDTPEPLAVEGEATEAAPEDAPERTLEGTPEGAPEEAPEEGKG